MLLFLLGVIAAAILPFLPTLYLPLFTFLILIIYLLSDLKFSNLKVLLSIIIIILIYLSSSYQKQQIDNLITVVNEHRGQYTLQVVEDNGDYYTLRLKDFPKGKVLLFTEEKYPLKTKLIYQGVIRQFNTYKNPGTYNPFGIYIWNNFGYITDATGEIEVVQYGEGSSRREIINFINSRLEKLNPDIAPLSKSVLLGDRRDLPTKHRENFIHSGLLHITAVSGLHVGIIYTICHIILKNLLSKKLSLTISYFGAFAFAVLVGFKPSTLRAILMLGIYSFAQIKGYPYSLKRALEITAILNILYNPLVVWDIGFQFSYLAVWGIAYIAPKLTFFEKIPNYYISSLLRITVGVQIAILPINFYYNRGFPLLTPLANLAVAPLLPVYLGLLTIFIIFPWKILGFFLEIISYYILAISQITGYWIHITDKFIVIFIFLSPCGYVLYKFKDIRRKFIILFTLFLFTIMVLYNQPVVKVHFIDVGQGDCALIQYNKYNILVDTGGILGANIGERVLLPTFKYLGVNKIHYLFITHPHYDHFGALEEIIDYVKIENILIPDNSEMYTPTFLSLLEKISKEEINLQGVKKGDSLKIGRMSKDIIHPPKNYRPKESILNNISLVTKLNYRGVKILFTGDIEREGEALLVPDLNVIDILKVAHHGSNTSTSEVFLETTSPEFAVISVGNNRYGHPAPEVINRLEERNIKTYITQRDGMVTVQIKRNGQYKITSFRR